MSDEDISAVEAANLRVTLRHLSTNLRNLDERRARGREGTALCGAAVQDQTRADWERDLYSGLGPRDISQLPMCKRCESKAKELDL